MDLASEVENILSNLGLVTLLHKFTCKRVGVNEI